MKMKIHEGCTVPTSRLFHLSSKVYGGYNIYIIIILSFISLNRQLWSRGPPRVANHKILSVGYTSLIYFPRVRDSPLRCQLSISHGAASDPAHIVIMIGGWWGRGYRLEVTFITRAAFTIESLQLKNGAVP